MPTLFISIVPAAGPRRRLALRQQPGTRDRHVTYQQVFKSCGKTNCGTCGGRALAHGPYWQMVEWDAGGRSQRCSYVGLRLPDDLAEGAVRRRFRGRRRR